MRDGEAEGVSLANRSTRVCILAQLLPQQGAGYPRDANICALLFPAEGERREKGSFRSSPASPPSCRFLFRVCSVSDVDCSTSNQQHQAICHHIFLGIPIPERPVVNVVGEAGCSRKGSLFPPPKPQGNAPVYTLEIGSQKLPGGFFADTNHLHQFCALSRAVCGLLRDCRLALMSRVCRSSRHDTRHTPDPRPRHTNTAIDPRAAHVGPPVILCTHHPPILQSSTLHSSRSPAEKSADTAATRIPATPRKTKRTCSSGNRMELRVREEQVRFG